MPEIIIDSDDNLTGANVNSDGLMVIRAATILNQGYGDFYAQMRAGLAGSNEVTGLAIIGKIDNEIGTVWKGGGGGGGDVSSIVAGLGIGITPVSGIGDVTINLAGQSYTAIEQIEAGRHRDRRRGQPGDCQLHRSHRRNIDHCPPMDGAARRTGHRLTRPGQNRQRGRRHLH